MFREMIVLPRITQHGFNQGLSGFIDHAFNTLVISFEHSGFINPQIVPSSQRVC